MTTTAIVKSPTERLSNQLEVPHIKKQFEMALGKSYGAFQASLIELFASDNYLQKCEPRLIVLEALKAASLGLAVNKQLGFAWIVPYKNIPQFQIGYKGLKQLALRTGEYEDINVSVIPEGYTVDVDIVTGKVSVSGSKASDKAIGYLAYFKLFSGYSKKVYMTVDEILDHAKKYSASYRSGKQDSAWKTDFDAMGKKTVLARLLRDYGILSVEMQMATHEEVDREQTADRGEQVFANQHAIEAEWVLQGEEKTEQVAEKFEDQEHIATGTPPF